MNIEDNPVDIIQEDIGINADSLAEIIGDLAADAGIMYGLERVLGTKIDRARFYAVAGSFHTISEIVGPAAVRELVPLLYGIPWAGKYLRGLVVASETTPAIKTLIKVAMLGLLQAGINGGELDPLGAGIILASDTLVNVGANIPVIEDALSFRL